MVDDVEIKNVGGFEGVASEATLRALLNAVQKQGGARAGQSAAQIQNLYNRSIQEGTKETGKFTKSIKEAGAAAKRLASELAVGGDRATDFAEALFGGTNVLTRMVNYLDRSIDTFRNLSSVGASFNNSIFDMMSASANSAMNLSDFTDMVARNSQTLASFGATTTAGARIFGDFSRRFRMGIGTQFFEMGFAIEDVNEGLMNFMDIERRRSSQNLKFDRSTQESAAEYILQLDRLAKLTGRQRRELEDSIARQVQDAGIRSQLNRLDESGRRNLQSALAFFDSELQGPLAEGLRDLLDGTPQTEYGRALASQIPGITQFAQRVFAGGASLEEVQSQLANNFGPQIERLAGSFSAAQLQQMRMQGGITGAIAEILDSGYQLNRLRGRDAAAAAAEQRRRDLITSTLGRFEQSVISIRKAVVDAFFDIAGAPNGLLSAFGALGDAISGLVEPGAVNGLNGIGNKLRQFMDVLFGPQGFVTEGVRRFTGWITSGGLQRSIEWLQQKFTDIGDWMRDFYNDVQEKGLWATLVETFDEAMDGLAGAYTGSWLERLINSSLEYLFGPSVAGDNRTFLQKVQDKLNDLLFGEVTGNTRPDGSGTDIRSGGIMETISAGFSSLMDSPLVQNSFVNAISNGFNTVQSRLESMIGMEEDESFGSWFRRLMGAGSDESIGDYFSSLIDETTAKLRSIVGMENGQSIGDWFSQLMEDTANQLKKLIGMNENESIGDWFSQLMEDTANQLKTLIGMNENETIETFITRMATNVTNTLMDVLTNRLPQLIGDIIASATNAAKEQFGGIGGSNLGPQTTAQLIARLQAGETLSEEERMDLIRTVRSMQQDASIAAGGVGALTGYIGRASSFIADPIADITGLDLEFASDQDILDSWNALQRPTRSLGTYGATGMTFEPQDTIAQIHQGERVLNPQETAQYNSQSQLGTKIDQLNSVMMRVATILEQGNQNTDKIARAVKTGGTDFYRGMPR